MPILGGKAIMIGFYVPMNQFKKRYKKLSKDIKSDNYWYRNVEGKVEEQ